MNIKFLLKEKKEIKFNNKIYILLIDFYSIIIIINKHQFLHLNKLKCFSFLYFLLLACYILYKYLN